MKVWLTLCLWLLALPAMACIIPPDVAAIRAEMLTLTNVQRAAAGLAGLTAEARLDRAAQAQACHTADRERLGHRGSWFAGLGRRLRREDYPFVMAVENLGEGQLRPAEIIAGWMRSSGHRVNMLAPAAREAGFGVARARNGRLYWAMVAAAR